MYRRCSTYDGKCMEKLHSDGNTLTETSFMNRVIRLDPGSGRAELEADTRHVVMVLRDLGLEKSSPVTPVAKRPKLEELLLAEAKLLNEGDTTLYRSAGPTRLVICCRLSGTRDEKSHDEGLRGTQTCWTLLERATGWSNCV